MLMLENLEQRLRNFLGSLPRGALVGRRNDPNRCVVSNFLSAALGVRVTVRNGCAKAPGLPGQPLPLWTCQWYDFLDSSRDTRRPSYTARTALEELSRCT